MNNEVINGLIGQNSLQQILQRKWNKWPPESEMFSTGMMEHYNKDICRPDLENMDSSRMFKKIKVAKTEAKSNQLYH